MPGDTAERNRNRRVCSGGEVWGVFGISALCAVDIEAAAKIRRLAEVFQDVTGHFGTLPGVGADL